MVEWDGMQCMSSPPNEILEARKKRTKERQERRREEREERRREESEERRKEKEKATNEGFLPQNEIDTQVGNSKRNKLKIASYGS